MVRRKPIISLKAELEDLASSLVPPIWHGKDISDLSTQETEALLAAWSRDIRAGGLSWVDLVKEIEDTGERCAPN